MIATTLLQIVNLLFNVVWWIVLVQFVLGLIIHFGNSRNDALFSIYRSLNGVLEPVLRPIRRLLPQTGALDLSPMVLLIVLQILLIILNNVVVANI